MYRVSTAEDWSVLVGKELTQICVGAFDVQMNLAQQVSITIHGDDPDRSFRHKTKSASSFALSGFPGRAAGLVTLLGSTIERVVVENEMTLALYFSNQEELRIYDCSDNYESFNITWPTGEIVV